MEEGEGGGDVAGATPVLSLVSGEDADFAIDARDQYGNHLDTIETFTFDIFQVERDGVVATDPPKFAFTTTRLQYDDVRRLLTGKILEVSHQPPVTEPIVVECTTLLAGGGVACALFLR